MTKGKHKLIGCFVGFVAVLGVIGISFTSVAQTTKKGMTWTKRIHTGQLRVDMVGCAGCDAYQGDTACTTALPILCIKKSSAPNPGVSPSGYYYGWSGGHIAITTPVVGMSLGSIAGANAICAAQLGPDWRMAEFHDGNGGWNFWAYGDVRSDSRFWTYINDQSNGNCF